jgi:putative endonuclease
MWDKGELVFVEVRTKVSDHFGTPVETVVRKKQRKIIQTAKNFLRARKISDEICCRFDLVGILLADNSEAEIEHVVNAFWAE